ncbi:MAG: NADH-quinone oxidoreductase subunit N, partial [Acidobacteria bacterium]|nr:NADH-quinone oxidoreductase subunit N [Acidobacteriota bacterium]
MFSLHPSWTNLLTPEIALLCFSIIFLIIAAIKGDHALRRGSLYLAILSLLFALFFVGQLFLSIPNNEHIAVMNTSLGNVSLIVDKFSLLFKALFIIGGIFTFLVSVKELDEENGWTGEYIALILFSILGMMVMAGGADLLTLWVGLETMALCIYVLAAYLRRKESSVEGALKYFVLGALSSGMYLYGVSFIYGFTSSIHLDALRAHLGMMMVKGGVESIPFPLAFGLVLLVVSLLFKIAIVPFHFWTPDAYEGATTPVTAFMSVAPKAAGFAMLSRILFGGMIPLYDILIPLLTLTALLTMVWGNIAAMLQSNAKRMLAYSSIAHAGYILAGVIAALKSKTNEGITAVIIYLFVYIFMNVGAFAVVIALKGKGEEGDKIEDFTGLFKRSPYLAVFMTFFLLSLGGIPPFAGFLGKFFIFMALVHSELY